MSNTVGSRRRFLGQTAALGALTCLAHKAPEHNPSINAARFQSMVGRTVLLRGKNGPQRVALAAVEEQPADPGRPSHVRQDPFSLIFRAPKGANFEDQICDICHPQLGPIKTFVSNIGPKDREVTLQVVFG